MNGYGSKMLHYLAWFLLFAFTGTCTFLLFRDYAPPGIPWLPVAGLVVFEIGLLHWLQYHKYSALNAVQAWIGLGMTLVSGLAITCATSLELLHWFSANGAIPTVYEDMWQTGILFAIIICVILNVFAFMAVSLVAPQHIAKWRELGKYGMEVEVRSVPSPQVAAYQIQMNGGSEETDPLSGLVQKIRRVGRPRKTPAPEPTTEEMEEVDTRPA